MEAFGVVLDMAVDDGPSVIALPARRNRWSAVDELLLRAILRCRHAPPLDQCLPTECSNRVGLCPELDETALSLGSGPQRVCRSSDAAVKRYSNSDSGRNL